MSRKRSTNLVPSDVVANNQFALDIRALAVTLHLGGWSEDTIGESGDGRRNDTRNDTTENGSGTRTDGASVEGGAAAADDAARNVRARTMTLWGTWNESVLAALERSGGGEANEGECCGELHFAGWVDVLEKRWSNKLWMLRWCGG